MLIFGRKQTSKGFNSKGKTVSGGGLRIHRTRRMATQGKGMKEDFYQAVETLQDKSKAYTPDFIKRFESVKIKSSKPKSYISF